MSEGGNRTKMRINRGKCKNQYFQVVQQELLIAAEECRVLKSLEPAHGVMVTELVSGCRINWFKKRKSMEVSVPSVYPLYSMLSHQYSCLCIVQKIAT